MMWSTMILAVLVAAVNVLANLNEPTAIEVRNGVMILGDKNFDTFLNQHSITFVMFHSPTCAHCLKLISEFEKAAEKLIIPLASVDTSIQLELVKRFSITGVPSLKLWHQTDVPIEFDDDDRTAEGIIRWVSQKIDPDYKPLPEAVVALTVETFDDFIESHPLVIVKFYALWCGHCKRLAPEYEKAARVLKEKNIRLTKIDVTVEKTLATSYNITGYPTLKIFRSGKHTDYNGPRDDAQGIVKYMLDQAKPPTKLLKTVKEVQRFMQKDDVTIIGFFSDENSLLLESLQDAAEMTRDNFYIGKCFEKEVFEYFKIKPNKIAIFYPEQFWSKYEAKRIAYDKEDASAEDLVAFFNNNALPLVGQITWRNKDTRYATLPLIVVYYTVDFSRNYRDGTQYWRNKVVEIANKYKNYRFAIGDEDEFESELKKVGLGDSGLEQNVIAFGYNGKKYLMDPDEFDNDFDENLSDFMKKLSSGRIRKYVLPAPLPKDDKGPVKALVGSNFEKIVFDESKDVLVEFYSPQCGHCQAFEPVYKALAKQLKSSEPNLLLAKLDATVNDAPQGYVVKGFPTLYFAPSGKKQKPIEFDGKREPDSIINFMKKHAVKSFKAKTEL